MDYNKPNIKFISTYISNKKYFKYSIDNVKNAITNINTNTNRPVTNEPKYILDKK